MRYDGYVIFVLYGSSNGYGARASANTQTLILSAFQFAVNILAMVGGYIDIQRVKLFQLVDSGEQKPRAIALQWR